MKKKTEKKASAHYDFTIGGQGIRVSKEDVLEKLKEAQPGKIQEHMVLVSNKWFPIKEALSLVTGIDLLTFQTAEALRVFKRLDFEVGRKSRSSI